MVKGGNRMKSLPLPYKVKFTNDSKNARMTNCYDCEFFVTNVELRILNRKFGSEIYPLDVEWKNCLQGPDAYLNCRKRRG